VARPVPEAMCGISSAPNAADTIGGTTGISQPPNAASGSTLSWVNMRNGIVAAVNSPPRVPAAHNTQARSTAIRMPTRSLPISNAPAPTVISAIGAAP
jgi:hypothetical protein